MTIAFTTLLVGGVFVILIATGLLTSRVLGWSRKFGSNDWLDAPFLGVSVIALVLQNLVYAGLPLAQTAKPFAFVVLVLTAGLAWRGRLLGMWAACPAGVLAMTAAVYIVHGVGMWVSGVEHYVGRAWGDQLNYVALAQYLIDVPFGASLSAAQPAEFVASRHAWVRIGQSVVHGFMTVCFGQESKTLFEPIILLSPALAAIAFYGLSRRARLPQRPALLLGAAAACLPAVAAIHQECFFSHALALPGLFYLIVLLDRATEGGDVSDYVKAALVCASTSSIYLELLPLLLLCVATFAVIGAPGARRPLRHVALSAAVAFAPFLLQATTSLHQVLAYSGLSVLKGLYPWALSIEGVERLWVGDLVGRTFDAEGLLRIVSIALPILGGLGLVAHVVTEAASRGDGGQRRWTGIARALVVLGFASVPWVILVRDTDHPYQFYKLLLSMAPFIVFGVGYAIWIGLARIGGRMQAIGLAVVIGPVLIVGSSATVDMSLASTHADVSPADPRYLRFNMQKSLDPAFVEVSKALLAAASTPRDIYQCVIDSSHNPAHVSAWFAIFARRHRLWALTPWLNDVNLLEFAGPNYYRWIPGPGATPLFVTTRDRGALWATPTDQFVTREVGPYRLVQTGSAPAVLACSPALEPNDSGAGLVRLGVADQADVNVFSSIAREVTIFFRSERVEGRPLPLELKEWGALQPLDVDDAGHHASPLSLRAGVTRLSIATKSPEGGRAVATNLAFGLTTPSVRLVDIANPNGLDFGLAKGFFWLGGGATRLTIHSSDAGVCTIDLELAPGPSVTKTQVRRIRVVGGGTPFDLVTSGGLSRLSVKVTPGWNHVTLEPLDPADTNLPSDPRPLIVSTQLKGLQLQPAGAAIHSRSTPSLATR